MTDFNKSIETLQNLDVSKMYGEDFFLTWEKSDDELQGVWAVADALRALRERNISTKVFDSGLGISLFRDNSTRTRFSFASACNLLGLEVQDLDEGKSQIAHGETVRETANMISFMADAAHIIKEFGGVENLKGKKLAMTWAYSPSYGKPLSVPQGAIGLFTRLGMEVVLAHPEGYEVMPEVEEIAKKQAEACGGSFRKTNDMKDAFKDADIVYPKSWAPFGAMEKRTKLYGDNDHEGIKALEKVLLEENGKHKDWACTEEMMSLTKDGKALYLHCLPADITGVSCEEGEVDATVFDRYRVPLYKEASYKPYVIAAMIFLSKFKNPVETLKELERKGTDRVQP